MSIDSDHVGSQKYPENCLGIATTTHKVKVEIENKVFLTPLQCEQQGLHGCKKVLKRERKYAPLRWELQGLGGCKRSRSVEGHQQLALSSSHLQSSSGLFLCILTSLQGYVYLSY